MCSPTYPTIGLTVPIAAELFKKHCTPKLLEKARHRNTRQLY